MLPQTPNFNEWLLAEKDAQAAERELHSEMLAASEGAPAPGLANLVLIAQAKRAKAHCLFDEAMLELKSIAESVPQRRIFTRPAAPGADARQER